MPQYDLVLSVAVRAANLAEGEHRLEPLVQRPQHLFAVVDNSEVDYVQTCLEKDYSDL